MTRSATDEFFETASIDYGIVDADAHVNEPPGLWQERVPERFRRRAPRVERTPEGDAWVFDDGKTLLHVGLTAMAGRSFLDYRNKNVTYAEMRPGSWDMRARLRDLDADGLFAQVLYPSITLTGAKIYGAEPELQHACVRAYNEWLLD